MRSCLRRFFAIACLVLAVLAVSGSCVVKGFSVGGDEASSRIGEADGALKRSFAAVLDAESAGASVSRLLAQLGWAGDNLTSAEAAYKSGDYGLAVSRAGECATLADAVAVDAGVLKNAASVAASGEFWRAVMFSAVGGTVFAGVLFLVWRRFRSVYSRRVLGSKPEVVADVEA